MGITNAEILAIYIASGDKVLIGFDMERDGRECHDRTTSMDAQDALPLVKTLERLGARVSVYRFEI